MSTLSIIRPLKPKGSGWQERDTSTVSTMGYAKTGWYYAGRGLLVISAVEHAETEKGGENIGAVYHLSISKNAQRCTSNEAKWVLRQFSLDDAEEDNHVPNGFVRNFFRAVADKFSGYQCPCKSTEPVMKENKGDYVWRGVSK